MPSKPRPIFANHCSQLKCTGYLQIFCVSSKPNSLQHRRETLKLRVGTSYRIDSWQTIPWKILIHAMHNTVIKLYVTPVLMTRCFSDRASWIDYILPTWYADYYLFIKYYFLLHVSSLKCSSSGGYSFIHAASSW